MMRRYISNFNSKVNTVTFLFSGVRSGIARATLSGSISIAMRDMVSEMLIFF